MTDEELGHKIHNLALKALGLKGVWGDDTAIAFGAAARELLTKPVATREALEEWAFKLPPISAADVAEKAISHFAPPAPPLPPICGMSVEELRRAMFEHRRCNPKMDGISADADCVIRLAQPAQADPDAEAKAAIEAFQRGMGILLHPGWDEMDETHRNGWRAVAAMENPE